MSLRCCGVPEPTAGTIKGSPTSSQPPATFPPPQGDKPAPDAPDSSRATTPVRMSEDTSPSPAVDRGTLSMRSGSSSSGTDRAAPNQVAPGSATPSQRRRRRRDKNGRHLALVDRHSDSADHSALLHLLTVLGLLGDLLHRLEAQTRAGPALRLPCLRVATTDDHRLKVRPPRAARCPERSQPENFARVRTRALQTRGSGAPRGA